MPILNLVVKVVQGEPACVNTERYGALNSEAVRYIPPSLLCPKLTTVAPLGQAGLLSAAYIPASSLVTEYVGAEAILVIVNHSSSVSSLIRNMSPTAKVSFPSIVKVEESKTFTPERPKELKEIKPKEWLSKKKTEFIEILEEGGIDYSAVKDDRMALYRFLVDVLSNM